MKKITIKKKGSPKKITINKKKTDLFKKFPKRRKKDGKLLLS